MPLFSISYRVQDLLSRLSQELLGVHGHGKEGKGTVGNQHCGDVVFYDPNKGAYRGHDEIDRISYQPIDEPEEVMGGGFHGYWAALAMRQHTPERISSSPGTDGSPPSISSSTSYPEIAARCIDPSEGTAGALPTFR